MSIATEASVVCWYADSGAIGLLTLELQPGMLSGWTLVGLMDDMWLVGIEELQVGGYM